MQFALWQIAPGKILTRREGGPGARRPEAAGPLARDLKPEAPAEVRGEFKPADTNVAGIQITPHLPRLVKMADKYATFDFNSFHRAMRAP